MADSRSLDDLHPHVRIMAGQLLADAAAAGIPLTVTFTLRSMATQAALYAQGRTCPGCVVTNARPGYSFHNYGLALDVVPTELLALPRWGDTPARQAHTDALWVKLGAIGKRLGFRWGGEFKSIRDRPHFEWSGGFTLAALRAGARPSTPTIPLRTSSPKERKHEINIGKLARMIGHMVVAAPAVIAAVKPVVDELKKPTKLAG